MPNDNHQGATDCSEAGRVKPSYRTRIQAMGEANRRKAAKKWAQCPWLEKAMEMYSSGQGIKTIGKALGVKLHQVRKGLIVAGVYQGVRAKDYSKRLSRSGVKIFRPERLIMGEYESEWKVLARLDETRHWESHPIKLEYKYQQLLVKSNQAYHSLSPEAKKERNRASWFNRRADPVKLAKHKSRLKLFKQKPEQKEKAKSYLAKWKRTPQGRNLRRKIEKKPYNRMVRNLRARLREIVKGHGTLTRVLTGCSSKALRIHIESQFKEGMTWDNYGQWHLDHIIPCAAFDLTDTDQRLTCYHYSNLQPLWGLENSIKSDTLPNSEKGRHKRLLYRRPYTLLPADMDDTIAPVTKAITTM